MPQKWLCLWFIYDNNPTSTVISILFLVIQVLNEYNDAFVIVFLFNYGYMFSFSLNLLMRSAERIMWLLDISSALTNYMDYMQFCFRFNS